MKLAACCTFTFEEPSEDFLLNSYKYTNNNNNYKSEVRRFVNCLTSALVFVKAPGATWTMISERRFSFISDLSDLCHVLVLCLFSKLQIILCNVNNMLLSKITCSQFERDRLYSRATCSVESTLIEINKPHLITVV